MNREASKLMELPRNLRDDYIEKYPHLREIARAIEKAKETYRERNPEIDWLLVKWYGNEPRTSYANGRRDRESYRTTQKLITADENKSHPWVTPKSSWLQTSPSGRVTVDPARDERILTGF